MEADPGNREYEPLGGRNSLETMNSRRSGTVRVEGVKTVRVIANLLKYKTQEVSFC